MIVKKIEFSIKDVNKVLDSENKESRVQLILDSTNEEVNNLIYAPRKYLVSYESIIRKQ
ncbi:hypothetical protein [Ruminococcus sp.]|uniref:hypothetical protein n=1 Tax=Ruminococcus sp. TaxID=41978 RepID=UPI002E807E67|nr:hypothetical protein [Ruminococcus sp.]MEE3440640.1 hypothetical protein [Ruminococcus sp.]